MAKDDVDAIVKEIGNKASKILNSQNFSFPTRDSLCRMMVLTELYKAVKLELKNGKGENS